MGSFVEYGPLMFAAQERAVPGGADRRTPADGLVGGTGTVAGDPCIAMSYDYTVLAGTQGMRNHSRRTACSSWRSGAGCRSCCSPRAAAGAR